ncbi:MAG: hypothetical protein ACI9F9_000424 [Candidatus Paceibacteria bacterium]|jgi:hypothetical protein
MKFIKDKDRGLAGRIDLAMAGALFLGLLSFSVVGSYTLADEETGQGDDPRDDDGPGGGFATDDEFVGSLPTRGRDDELLTAPAPGFFLQGPRSQVEQAVLSASGGGHATIEVVEDSGNGSIGDDIIKLSFVGTVTLQLDANFLSNSSIEAGIDSLDLIGASLATALTDESLLMTAVLPEESDLCMPLADFSSAGFLQQGIHILTSNREYGRDQIDIEAIGGLIEVKQGIPLGL